VALPSICFQLLGMSMSQTFSVPYGQGNLEFQSPDGTNTLVAEPQRGQPVDVAAVAREVVRHPLAGPPLAELARPGAKVCVVFTDATRDVPDEQLVTAVLHELAGAGVRRSDILLLCGVGMHRPSTAEEKRLKLGIDTATRYAVIDSDARTPEDLTYLGDHGGIPLWVHRQAVEADLLIATGVVEPHQYAGYSGGRKTVAIGAGGEKTIAATHSPTMIDQPGVRLGSIDGNPFHETISESARRAGLRFIVNVLKDGSGHIVEVAAGDPDSTFGHLVQEARALYERQLDQQFDVVIAGVGYPKDTNLYQASRAVTYTYFAPGPVLRPGGVIILPAECPEGIGRGPGEQRFAQAMASSADPAEVVETLASRPTLAGEQRAYLLSKALAGCKVIVVGSKDPDAVIACHMTSADTMEEAISMARAWTRRDADILIAPHSLLVVLRGPGCPA